MKRSEQTYHSGEQVSTFDQAILKIAVAAKDLGASEERQAIIDLIAALHADMPGGPELKDRIIAAIEARGVSDAA